MASKKTFSHLGREKEASMVAIDHKTPTKRTAVAECAIRLPAELEQALKDNELYTPKGAVFETARIAGIMAVKKTAELIPLCHPILIEKCILEFQTENAGTAAVTESATGPAPATATAPQGTMSGGMVLIRCTVATSGKTGVEMEALTGASVAALTVYDMCKAISHEIVIGPMRLIEKTGGKQDFTQAGR